MTNILLIVIAILLAVSIALSNRNYGKKAYFQHKVRATQRTLWDLEFSAHKKKEIREEVRKELDFMKSRIDTFKKQLDQMDKKDEGRGEVEDNLSRAERDLQRLEGQINHIDIELNGAKPSEIYPNGVDGIFDQIDSYRALIEMLKDWVKKI